MKKILTRVGIGFLILFVLVVLRDQIIKIAVSNAASNIVGAPVQIGSLSFSLLQHTAQVNDLRLGNPKGFPREDLMDIQKIDVDYDQSALFQGKLHMNLIRVALKKVVIIRDKEGRLNVDALKVAQKKNNGKNVKPVEAMPFKIDTLELNIGKIVSKDLRGAKPSVEVYDLGMQPKIYKNITSAEQLAALMLAESLKHTAIKSALIYGAAGVVGVSFLPAGIAMIAMGDASAHENVSAGYDTAYRASLEAVRELGEVSEESKKDGTIKANVQGSDVTVTLEKNQKIFISVSARKFLMPNQKVAAGVLYVILEKLK